MLNKELEFTLNFAFKEARLKSYKFMTVEYLLLVLLDNSSANEVLHSCNVNIERLRQSLDTFIRETVPILNTNNSLDRIQDTQPTLGFQRVLQRAVFHVQSSGKTEVNGSNLLAAIFSEQESQAVLFLKQENISRLDVINFIAHDNDVSSINLDNKYNFNKIEGLNSEDDTQEEFTVNNLINLYTVNLNEEAILGKIDSLVGREHESLRLAQILCRRKKNNPLLVGEAGVGKTAIVEGLAKLITEDNVPEQLKKAKIYSLDLGALVAGTKYRGDFEKRFKAFLKQFTRIPHAVLFIDEIHTIIGAGAASGGVIDVANLLKPYLSKSEIKCIGSTTFKEYQNIFQKDYALSRRFQKIMIKEPNILETCDILMSLKNDFEKFHGVEFTDESLKTAASLADKYLHDRFMPDKAIDIVDETGAYQQILPEDKRKKLITSDDIKETISRLANVPLNIISKTESELLSVLSRNLSMSIYGQAHAIEQVVSSVLSSKAGLGNKDKPICSFLFSGPTGVGKTELTKQLAHELGVDLIRFDMSEYMERHSVSKLIGAPPGYVGYEGGGLLTEEVLKKPHAVLLLDEIEKANTDIYNILLQIMDYGMLTDSVGRKVDFKHIILIMTTNVGAQEVSRSSFGFKSQDHNTDVKKAMERVFAPEFRNRLDSVVQFDALGQEVKLNIVDKFITALELQLAEKNIEFKCSKKAKLLLADIGYDELLGARPMERIIRERLHKPISNEILFGKLAKGGVVNISTVSSELCIRFNESLEKAK